MKSKILVCRDEIWLTLAFTRQDFSFKITRISSNNLETSQWRHDGSSVAGTLLGTV